MHTLSYLMKDDTLEPNAFSIPANSTAMYPAPITAVFLIDQKNTKLVNVLFHYSYVQFLNKDRPFLSYLVPLFPNQSLCKTFKSQENEFDLHENEPVGRTHFHMNGFAHRFILTQWQKATRKWSIQSWSMTLLLIFPCKDLSDQTTAQSNSFLLITLTSSPHHSFTCTHVL